MKKWLGRLAKLGFFLAAFIGVIATVLFNMGGSGNTLKTAIEDYISASTGYSARIQSFNEMTFFPSITLDIGNVILKKPDLKALESWAKAELEKPESEQGQSPLPQLDYNNPDAVIEHALVSVGFFDAGFGRGRKLKNLQIKNATFNAGTLHHKPVNIKSLGIDETPQGEPFIGLDGTIGGQAFNGQITIESIGSRSNPKYKFGEEGAFEFNIDSIKITGIMRPRTLGGVHIRDLVITNNEQPVLTATFSLIREGSGNIDVKGDFTLDEQGSTGSFEWGAIAENNMQINGSVSAADIYAQDFNEGARLNTTLAKWNAIFANPDTSKDVIHNITLNAERFYNQSNVIENYQGKVNITDTQITVTQEVDE